MLGTSTYEADSSSSKALGEKILNRGFWRFEMLSMYLCVKPSQGVGRASWEKRISTYLSRGAVSARGRVEEFETHDIKSNRP